MDPNQNNSRKEAVVGKGSASESKKQSFLSLLFAGDFETASRMAFTEVIVPKLAEIFTESVNVAANSMVYGNDYYPSSKSSKSNTPYNVISTSKGTGAKTRQETKSSDHRDVRSILFSDPRDAEKVRNQLKETAKEYPIVTVTDFYDFSNMGEKTVAADAIYGWDSETIQNVGIATTRWFNEDIRRYETRYFVDLPKATKIDD